VLDLHQSSDVDLEIALALKPEVCMGAHQIMTGKLITAKADTPFLEAANLMLQRHISGSPVVDDAGVLIGMVSEGDFIRRGEIGTHRE
jgi:CBS domain-containing protein